MQSARAAIEDAAKSATSDGAKAIAKSLAERLLASSAIEAIAAAALSVPTLLASTNSLNGLVNGTVLGRPDITYRWSEDDFTLTYNVLVDGQ